jgi:hypothetical protein
VIDDAGVTPLEPEASGVTEPMPLSIENDVAFVVVHERIEAPPTWIVFGAATRVHFGVGG